MLFSYDASRGIAYARLYAEYFSVPVNLRLFHYDINGSDCANFVSQCVWASYGGWIQGFDENTVAENKERIRKMVRMVPGVWFDSLFYSGSNKWCRVMEFYEYALANKTYGPKGYKIYEGDWQSLDPSIIRRGDVIQMVVASYASNRYGHSLYVTKEGKSLSEVEICCHSFDRRDAPLTDFSVFPDQYKKLRIIRFTSGNFQT